MAGVFEEEGLERCGGTCLVLVTLQLLQKTGEQGMGFWFISRHHSTSGQLIPHENQESMKYVEILKTHSSRKEGVKFFFKLKSAY